MLIIGLTGGLATGKTTVAKMFAQLGAQVIDADKIAHKLISPRGACYTSIVRYFGGDIVTKGNIDRKKLSTIVFNNKHALRKLEGIIHPEVKKNIFTEIKKRQKKNSIIIIDAPLLIEAGIEKKVDRLIVVKSSLNKQIKRSSARLKITKSEALKRIKAQMPLKDKERLADIVINNNEDLENTRKQVKAIWEKIFKK